MHTRIDTGLCFFVSDLHGSLYRYGKLLDSVASELPSAVFIGGDILPNAWSVSEEGYFGGDFVAGYLTPELLKLRKNLKNTYPEIFVILGNDDNISSEDALMSAEEAGLCRYAHNRKASLGRYRVYGYSHIPPTPFPHKDWERYDVSRYVDPGCVSPEEGYRAKRLPSDQVRYSTIQRDLAELSADDDLSNAIMLFHTPPYDTKLDRAALDNVVIDHVPADVHVGSIAVRRFIESKQPLVTLHGHVHDSARITGSWRDEIGRTHMFSAAHDGSELALVRFRLGDLENATRELL